MVLPLLPSAYSLLMECVLPTFLLHFCGWLRFAFAASRVNYLVPRQRLAVVRWGRMVWLATAFYAGGSRIDICLFAAARATG